MIFLHHFISFVKKKANSGTEQQKCKGHEKRDRLLIAKMEFNYQISQGSKVKNIDVALSNLLNFIKKNSNHNLIVKIRDLRAYIFL